MNSETAIETMPSLLSFLSHNYFPTTVLVGPLIPYRQFITYIESEVNHLPKCWKLSLTRLLLGMLYFAGYNFASKYFPSDYLLSDHYHSLSFFAKIAMIAIVARLSLFKYITCWLMSEGASIASGITFDGHTYYSCSNISVIKYESSLTTRDLIESFNLTVSLIMIPQSLVRFLLKIYNNRHFRLGKKSDKTWWNVYILNDFNNWIIDTQTNAFAMKYIYKRLKFLCNKNLSQALTLLFLSVWHGIDSGYFVTFAMEFLYIRTEHQFIKIVNDLANRSKTFKQILYSNNGIIKAFKFIVIKTVLLLILGYCFIPMLFVKYEFWYSVLKSVFFYGHAITLSFLVISFIKF